MYRYFKKCGEREKDGGEMSVYLSVAEAGADRTGERVATEVIQGCIDRAAESGEEEVFPKGRYLSGGLYLRNGVFRHARGGSAARRW